MNITKEQILGVIRHALTAVGVYLVSKGIAGEGLVEEGIGAALTLVSIVWSVLSKKTS